MFRLTASTEPRWLELPHGVRIRVRPLSGVFLVTARNAGEIALQEEAKQAGEAARAGAPLDPRDLNVLNTDFVAARLEWAKAEHLGRHGILAWEGVVDEAGAPVPYTHDNAVAIATDPSLMRPFLEAYFATLTPAFFEGEGSGRSSDTATEEAPATAEAAPAETIPEPEPQSAAETAQPE
ncbi:hypothetical protein M0638_25050 [Roseomonas sp. NAR14]|uniref:Uncharacterized protein n=1 Tax=Roseomonas acroporae TaxID=2937791 RepID=A0A9X1YBD1_9PROT|nr:hypothetical protein [Roseomonas acroporae]MCK8787639.1 hypothetical protein [Roseomonas acroporae]